MVDSSFAGLRVFLVEDEALVAMLMEELLAELGCILIGHAARLGAAQKAVAKAALDLAILDINVNGELVYPLAEALAGRGTPFLFVTGYARAEIAARFRDRPVLAKPFDCDTLTAAMRQALAWR